MAINIGGHSFTEAQILEALTAQNTVASDPGTAESNTLAGVVTRLLALEERLPITRAGFGVTTTPGETHTTYRVQVLDHHGDTQIITFELPN